MACVFDSLPLGAIGWSVVVVVAFPGHIHLVFTLFIIIIKFDYIFGYIYCAHI